MFRITASVEHGRALVKLNKDTSEREDVAWIGIPKTWGAKKLRQFKRHDGVKSEGPPRMISGARYNLVDTTGGWKSVS